MIQQTSLVDSSNAVPMRECPIQNTDSAAEHLDRMVWFSSCNMTFRHTLKHTSYLQGMAFIALERTLIGIHCPHSHTCGQISLERPTLRRMGVPHPFPMRNRRPYPFSRPQWPSCLLSISTDSCFVELALFYRVSSHSVFLVSRSNRLGGDSFCFVLCFLRLFLYFRVEYPSLDPPLRCD